MSRLKYFRLLIEIKLRRLFKMKPLIDFENVRIDEKYIRKIKNLKYSPLSIKPIQPLSISKCKSLFYYKHIGDDSPETKELKNDN